MPPPIISPVAFPSARGEPDQRARLTMPASQSTGASSIGLACSGLKSRRLRATSAAAGSRKSRWNSRIQCFAATGLLKRWYGSMRSNLRAPYYSRLAEATMRYVLSAPQLSTIIPAMKCRAEVDMNNFYSDGAKVPAGSRRQIVRAFLDTQLLSFMISSPV